MNPASHPEDRIRRHSWLSRLAGQFLDIASGLVERVDGRFVTYHSRPRSADGVGTPAAYPVPAARCGIVVQGPIITTENFTRDTLRIYRRHNPNAIIILSTWGDENASEVEAVRRDGFEVVLNDKPQVRGTSNINLQLVSSFQGIRRAVELGAEYVLKTRSDQRIYAPNALPFLLEICRAFPIQDSSRQHMRLVGCSLNTFMYRLYGMSDMLLFGHYQDMLTYWGAPHEVNPEPAPPQPHTMGTSSRWRVCEVYLETQYLETIGHTIKWTLADSLQAITDRFCVVDQESLDLYWPKYRRRQEYRYRHYDASYTNQQITFRDWLSLRVSRDSGIWPSESILDLPFDTAIPDENATIHADRIRSKEI